MELAQQVGKRLKAARIAAGYKFARAFTKEFGIPESTYSQHESGNRSLSVEALMEYGKRLAVDAGWLLTGSGVPYKHNNYDAEKQLVLFEQLKEIDPELSYNLEERSIIEGSVSYVDISLFREVWEQVIPVLESGNINMNSGEVFDFVVEIYNGIATTSANKDDQRRMIALSIVSLQRGMGRS